jgi:uncharacterized membrane protein
MIPERIRDVLIRQDQIHVWGGDFPPPEAIERYESVLPGAFDRILAMAERQQAARDTLQLSALTAAASDARRGHWLGAGVAALGMALGVACAWRGQPWLGGLMVAVPVMSVAKALIDSARGSERREPEKGAAPDQP